MLKVNKVYQGDCLDVMGRIEDKSIDMILCDLPYGTTQCPWDTIIPFELLWKAYERILKNTGGVVLTACQPFTSLLIVSNLKWYRYHWVWHKRFGTGFLNAKKQPLRVVEDIVVFGRKPKYNPQMLKGYTPYKTKQGKTKTQNYGDQTGAFTSSTGERFPVNLLNIDREMKGKHPTQKPIKLFEYLIKTYTDEGDLVLDNCAGSGTTGVACIKTNRNFILIEKEKDYCKLSQTRIKKAIAKKENSLFHILEG